MKVFISYRREDVSPWAGRIYEKLAREFSTGHVFMDVDSIQPGDDFAKVLASQIAECDVMLVLIGKNWLDARDRIGARRLFDIADFVRFEIETAVNRGIRIIPVLLDGARPPREDELPASLSTLATLQSIELTHERFKSDSALLITSLRRQLIDADGVSHFAFKITSLVLKSSTTMLIAVGVFVGPLLIARSVLKLLVPSTNSALLLGGVLFLSAVMISLFAALGRGHYSTTALAFLGVSTTIWASTSAWFFLVGSGLEEWSTVVVPVVVLGIAVGYAVFGRRQPTKRHNHKD